MGAVGGSVASLGLAGRNFTVTADNDPSRKLGGFENEIVPNGDGSARTTKTRVPWMLSDLEIATDDTRGDQEFLQDLSDSNEDFPVTITYASGKTYQGKGQISGELPTSAAATTTAINLSGSGKLTPQ